jgi:hypothetical protein
VKAEPGGRTGRGLKILRIAQPTPKKPDNPNDISEMADTGFGIVERFAVAKP